MMNKKADYKSGFITLIGRPNAGKSTLINQLVGEKVAIISDKPQTTRNTIHGVYTDQEKQIIILDTPGVHKPKYKLGERMMNSVQKALEGCDIILYLVDANEEFGAGEKYIINMLDKLASKIPVFLIINKIDLLERQQILPLISFYANQYHFQEILPVSALCGDNKGELLKTIAEYLKPGPMYYPPDTISDLPDNILIAELIREQALRLTKEEIPHSLAVTVAAMEERDNGLMYIEANIYIERDSQKGMVIGKGGAMLKKIGAAARIEIEKIFGCKVYLDILVKTKKDWRNNSGLLNAWLPKE